MLENRKIKKVSHLNPFHRIQFPDYKTNKIQLCQINLSKILLKITSRRIQCITLAYTIM